jgi:2-polyprenyl-3-methyl-5-hydroxy-6-metoxy-1,4-benzoquinol methylase
MIGRETRRHPLAHESMPKQAEIDYVARMSRVLEVPTSEVERFLMGKPYTDPACGTYLIDVGQVLNLLPPPPARVLDLGTGSGWTAEMLARRGYQVVGADIAPDMIALARRRLDPALELRYEICDYEASLDVGEFDAAVIYDALHHAENEAAVIANAHACLKPGGILITIEPGHGHSRTAETLDVIAKFGTTEKDMPYRHQARLMKRAGFRTVRQYLRLSQLALDDLVPEDGRPTQEARFTALLQATATGLTSVVVAVKERDPASRPPTSPPRSLSLPAAIRESVRTLRSAIRESRRLLGAALADAARRPRT